MKYAVTLIKGNSCHKNVTAVMANSGFGDLTITKNGMTIYIPQSAMKKSDGKIKKTWQNRIDNFTVESALWLNEKIAA